MLDNSIDVADIGGLDAHCGQLPHAHSIWHNEFDQGSIGWFVRNSLGGVQETKWDVSVKNSVDVRWFEMQALTLVTNLLQYD